jgi:hypothetical protein
MMKKAKEEKEQESLRDDILTKKGRRFMREERYLEGLSERERMVYEECMALVQTLGQNGSLDEVCGWLERYALDKRNQ